MARKLAPYTPLWAPTNVSKPSLEAKITAENAFSDLGAHTNVVRNALLLPMALVWSRLVDIDFWGHFGSFWVILGHSGSFWVILGHSGSFWVILVHSGSILGSFTARNSLK